MKHKLQAQNKKVVEEFDRAKQRMYKRYERALDPNKKASKRDLSYAEYYEWLENAAEARDAYLAGKLSEKDALKAIIECPLDPVYSVLPKAKWEISQNTET